MTPPLVSIIIPVHNAARWLHTTLESALAQTWPRCEIVAVDDGSTDDSASIVRGFESRGVRLTTSPHRGAAAARNVGFASSHGDLIQFLDADDLLAADKIAQQVPPLMAAPRHVASAAWARFTGTPGEVPTEYPNWRDMSGVDFLCRQYEAGSMMHPAAWLTPRDLILRVGPWDETLSVNDDGEFFSRIVLAAEGIAFCRQARSFYRSNVSGSLSQRTDPAGLASLFRSTELITSHLLAAERSARTTAAVAHAWKWIAYDLYPDSPALSREAWRRCLAQGGSTRPFPASRPIRWASHLVGWRIAKRLSRWARTRRETSPA
ncbi:MAG TPA: glycosyltransferase [Candidatus Synoicihabitans sp.]|nr:glycosyltransferase [Candidatus Synoicihabitans sp.]